MGMRHGMQPQMIPVLTSARHHRARKRLVNVEIVKEGHQILPNWTFQEVKLPECRVGAMVTRRMMLTTDALYLLISIPVPILDGG
jgi:hypothetical protein